MPPTTLAASSAEYSTLATPPFSVVVKVGFQRVLVNLQERHRQILWHFLAVEDHLRHPEGKRRNAGCNRHRHGLILVGVLLFLPPLDFILAVAHDDGGGWAACGGKGLCRTITITTLRHHGLRSRQRWQNASDGLLRHFLGPITMHGADDLELRILSTPSLMPLEISSSTNTRQARGFRAGCHLQATSWRDNPPRTSPIVAKSTAMR